MSLRENVEVIKQELSAEEQFFEKAVVTERFITKYKKQLLAIGVVIVLFAFGKVGYDVMEQNRLSAANKALLVLEKNPNNKQAQEELKSNSQKLYDLWLFSQAMKKDDMQTLSSLANKNLLIISDVASYQVAAKKEDIKQLSSYSLEQNKVYKDLAAVEEGVALLKEGKTTQAKEKFNLLPKESVLRSTVAVLKHYGVK